MGVKSARPNLISKLDNNLHLVGCYAILAMTVFTAASVPLGIFAVDFDGRLIDGMIVEGLNSGVEPRVVKQVGYLAALNWSLYGALIVPVMLVFTIRIWACMPDLVHELSAKGMIRDRDFQIVDPADIMDQWRGIRHHAFVLFGLMFICVMVFIMVDWWGVVAEPILNPSVLKDVPLSHPVREFDWSIASVYEGNKVSKYPLLVFGFIGYFIIAGLATAMTWGTCLATVFYVLFLCGVIGHRHREWRLVAVPSVTEPRGGFETFARLITAFLILSLSAAIGCLLMIIQNAYLRDPNSTGVVSFMFGDLRDLLNTMTDQSITNALDEVPAWIVAPAVHVYENPQTGFGVLLFGFTALVALGVSWGTLRSAAKTAREFSLQNIPILAKEQGVTPGTITKRLNSMEFWPIGWLHQKQLVILMLSLMLCLASYRLLIVPFVLVLISGTKGLWDLYKEGKKAKAKR